MFLLKSRIGLTQLQIVIGAVALAASSAVAQAPPSDSPQPATPPAAAPNSPAPAVAASDSGASDGDAQQPSNPPTPPAVTPAIAAPSAVAPPFAPAPPAVAAPHPKAPKAPAIAPGRSYLGVDINDVTSDRVGALKLKEEHGVEVVMLDKDGPAAKAGIKEHDVILELNGAKVEGEEQFRRALRETPPGHTVSLTLSRDGDPVSIQVKLGDREKLMGEMTQKWTAHIPRLNVMPKMPVMPDFAWASPDVRILRVSPTKMGVVVDNLTPQLGDYFGVKNGEGVLIRSVERGSPADSGGLRAGDIITKIDSENITDRSDLNRALRQKQQGGKITIGIVRDKHEQSLIVTLLAGKDNSSLFEFTGIDAEDLRDVLEDIPQQINNAVLIAMNTTVKELQKNRTEIQQQASKAAEEARKQLRQLRNQPDFRQEF